MSWPKPYRFACPNCRRVYARSVSRVLLGPGTRKCVKCLAVFRDGTFEWRVLAWKPKLEFLLSEKARFYFAGCILVATAIALLTSRLEDAVPVAIFSVGIAAIPLAIRLVRCTVQIRESVKRSEAAWLVQAGYHSQETSWYWQK
jgi:hypothetical protein